MESRERRLSGYHYKVFRVVELGLPERLVGLVADEGNNHAVEVEEEHEQVKGQLDEGFLSRRLASGETVANK